jgi:hypothetical protein
MKRIKVEVFQDKNNEEVNFAFSGEDLVFNVNNFFNINSIMTFVPVELIGDLAIQLSQIAEDIQRSKEDDLENQRQKCGEERRDSEPLERETND